METGRHGGYGGHGGHTLISNMEEIKAYTFWLNKTSKRKFIVINLWDGDTDDTKNWIVLKEIKPGSDNPAIHLSMQAFKEMIASYQIEEWI